MLKNEIDEWKDKYTRLAAEYDNYRKRTLKEIDMRYDDAKVDVWKNIIGIIDDFDVHCKLRFFRSAKTIRMGFN